MPLCELTIELLMYEVNVFNQLDSSIQYGLVILHNCSLLTVGVGNVLGQEVLCWLKCFCFCQLR